MLNSEKKHHELIVFSKFIVYRDHIDRCESPQPQVEVTITFKIKVVMYNAEKILAKTY